VLFLDVLFSEANSEVLLLLAKDLFGEDVPEWLKAYLV
jgi:hypothetical protein